LIRRGAERFDIYCSACHGTSGNGEGMTASFGVPVNTNVNAKLNAHAPGSYPDGKLFETISKGMGRMSGYNQTIPIRDRWAIIAYIHTLQTAKASAVTAP
jgi:mono/diheme cytochrome c family protein